jgi:hypothetical protein
MESSNPHTSGNVSNQAFNPGSHFFGSFVRKGKRENLTWIDSLLFDQIGDSVCQYACFARAGACQHEQWAVRGNDSFALNFI